MKATQHYLSCKSECLSCSSVKTGAKLSKQVLVLSVRCVYYICVLLYNKGGKCFVPVHNLKFSAVSFVAFFFVSIESVVICSILKAGQSKSIRFSRELDLKCFEYH